MKIEEFVKVTTDDALDAMDTHWTTHALTKKIIRRYIKTLETRIKELENAPRMLRTTGVPDSTSLPSISSKAKTPRTRPATKHATVRRKPVHKSSPVEVVDAGPKIKLA